MLESRNFYVYIDEKFRDWIIDEFDQGRDLLSIKKQIRARTNLNVDMDQIREAIVLSYVDSGESEKAFQLACLFRDQSPSANIHNTVLKCMLSSWEYSQQLFLEESRKWAALYANERVGKFAGYSNAKPRIGFVCDYGSTVFGENAIFPLCHSLSKSGFEVYYYNFERIVFSINDDSINILNGHDLSSAALSERIKKDKVDILVDLNGRLREHHRLGVFAQRSAPVQVNYFNLVGTMGMQNYDYMVVDGVQVTRSDEQYYTERALHLPCGVNGAFAFKRDVEIVIPDRAPGAPFTFASFNAFFKINTVLLETWAEILRRVPDSRLVIKCHETNRNRVIKKIAKVFSRSGIDLGRILIEGWSSLLHLRRQYAEVDLCLDTFPYSGGSTTLNALWQGVPVLTWCGEGWRARTSASMLQAAGVGEMAVSDRKDYVEAAVQFARDFRRSGEMRYFLKTNIGTNAYFQPERVYGELATALKAVVRRDDEALHAM